MLTATQKATAQAIVNVFETGTVRGNYGNVTVIAGDTGHLTFGRSQTTLGNPNHVGLLGQLLNQYCAASGARFAHLINPYLQRVAQADLSLDTDSRLHNRLRATADDGVMRDVQDAFFDLHYWSPALASAGQLGLALPLSMAVVYDSTVHGSWQAMRDLTHHEANGTPAKVGEKAWIQAYIKTRRNWLASHTTRPDLQATVYRMDSLQRLLDYDLWMLPLPIIVRDQEINLQTLAAEPPLCYSGPAPGTRALAMQGQMLRGLDVRLFQLGLSETGCNVIADGAFGKNSLNALHAYQRSNKLPLRDIADATLVEALAQSVA